MTASRTLERDPQAGGSGPGHARPFFGRLSGLIDRARGRVDRGVGFLARMRTPLGEVRPYVPGETPVARLLAAPAIVGFVSAVAIAWGASLPSSPFTWKSCSGIVPGLGHRMPPVVLRHPRAADGGRRALAREQEPVHRSRGRLRGHGAHVAGLDRPDPHRAPPPGPARPILRGCVRRLDGPASCRGAAVQPGLVQLRGPGRDDEPRDQPVLVRAGGARRERLLRAGRQAVGRRDLALRARVPLDRGGQRHRGRTTTSSWRSSASGCSRSPAS